MFKICNRLNIFDIIFILRIAEMSDSIFVIFPASLDISVSDVVFLFLGVTQLRVNGYNVAGLRVIH